MSAITSNKIYPGLGFRTTRFGISGSWIKRDHFRHTHNQTGQLETKIPEYGKQMKLSTVDPEGLAKKIEELSSYEMEVIGYGPEGVYIYYRGSNSRYGLNKEETIRARLYEIGYVSDLKIKSMRTLKTATDKPFVRGEYFEPAKNQNGANGVKGKMVKGDRK